MNKLMKDQLMNDLGDADDDTLPELREVPHHSLELTARQLDHSGIVWKQGWHEKET
jgi:hypothetical protein